MSEKAEQTRGKKSRAGRDLPAALIVGLSFFSLVIVALIFFPMGVVILLALLVAMAAFELRDALRQLEIHPVIAPVILGIWAVIAAACAVAEATKNAANGLVASGWVWVIWATIAGATLLILLWRMPKGSQDYVRDVAGSWLIFGYLGVLAAFVGPLLLQDMGSAKLAIVFMCVCGSDTGGYVLGASMGKHQLAPQISPKKTWEGLLGSVLLASVVGILMAIFALGMPWWVGLVVAILAVVFGTAGDLVESLIKRDIGIKDMSSILPGHGGIMERLDSMLFAFPVGWAFFALLPL